MNLGVRLIVSFGAFGALGVGDGTYLLGYLDDILLELLADLHGEVLGALHDVPALLVHCETRRGYVRGRGKLPSVAVGTAARDEISGAGARARCAGAREMLARG